jgi:hypothetical protein
MATTFPHIDQSAAKRAVAAACLNAQVRIGTLGNGKALARRYVR